MGDFTPTPAEIKALVAQRVGGEPFGPDTVPSLAQVTELIELVVVEVTGAVADLGGTVALDAAELNDLARVAVKLGTAAQVELTFFPEQQEGAGSTASLLHERYRDVLARLRDVLRNAGSATDPLYSFPDACAWPDPVSS